MADLNGTWLGTYWQQGVPSRFEAVFVQSGSALSGSILDDNYLGEAQITGEVHGRNVRFTKRYLITSPAPINYIGTLSENEDYIKGQWNIGPRFSGPWEAHRSTENLMDELNTRIQKQIPQATG
ncbi:hypothetical protein [Calothrix sp. NIES-2098]|uniref:hypothetical protein n=1 Tax=Calothrix sp. NIES-2098 TaxID=1954171 RepID=UPI000BBC1A07